MISLNPLLGPQWQPLGFVLMQLFEYTKKNNRRNFSMNTYGHKYGLSPYSSPYAQACVDSFDRLQVEVSANLQVRPELTEEQFQALEFYGWLRPHENPVDGADEDSNPNFSRYFEANADPLDIAEFVLTSLVGVYGLTEDDFFGFSGKDMADRVANMKQMGRLKSDAGNPDGEIFALPGKHLQMLEPSSIINTVTLAGPNN